MLSSKYQPNERHWFDVNLWTDPPKLDLIIFTTVLLLNVCQGSHCRCLEAHTTETKHSWIRERKPAKWHISLRTKHGGFCAEDKYIRYIHAQQKYKKHLSFCTFLIFLSQLPGRYFSQLKHGNICMIKPSEPITQSSLTLNAFAQNACSS